VKEFELKNNGTQHLDSKTLLTVSQTFKALGNSTRIRILHLLLNKECSVNEMAEILGIQQSTISHQLRFLKGIFLVKYRRSGRTLYYSYNDKHVMLILEQMIDHVNHR